VLRVRRRLIVNRSIQKAMGQAHRHFIALDHLRKLNPGDDVSSFGVRHHEPMIRELDMFHWNLFSRCCGAHRNYQQSDCKESDTPLPSPVCNLPQQIAATAHIDDVQWIAGSDA
jgi:hypothetical protein